VGNDRQFRALCGGREVPELVLDKRFETNTARVAHIDELAVALTGRLATQSATQWVALLSPLGVPCGPVNDIAGAFALAEKLGLEPTVPIDDGPGGVRLAANPIGLSSTPPSYRSRPPGLGEHTDQLTAWLDLPRTDAGRTDNHDKSTP
jgi:crotonobetainyl-CoA:carnitine CoA-transferase CaiB-like acyl-CoA transferase